MDILEACAILGVSPDDTQKEIKTVYRKLVLEYHPDKNKKSENKFKEIVEAYKAIIAYKTITVHDEKRSASSYTYDSSYTESCYNCNSFTYFNEFEKMSNSRLFKKFIFYVVIGFIYVFAYFILVSILILL